MERSLADVRLAALMLDGLELKGRCCVVAFGISTDGVKVPLGLWDGSTENKRVCVELLYSSTAAWTATRASSSSWMAARPSAPLTPSSAMSPFSAAIAIGTVMKAR